MPGANDISGDHVGADAATTLARRVAGYGLHFDLLQVLDGRSAFALYQHNTAEHQGLQFDEHVATVCEVQDNRIVAIDTLVSDLGSFDRFFCGSGVSR